MRCQLSWGTVLIQLFDEQGWGSVGDDERISVFNGNVWSLLSDPGSGSWWSLLLTDGEFDQGADGLSRVFGADWNFLLFLCTT